jgi:serine/threonine protein kinase
MIASAGEELMIDEQWQRVQELFEEALTHPMEERASFLAEACGDDADTRVEVESLLEHDRHTESRFMRVPEGSSADDRIGVSHLDPLIGKRIGEYTVKSAIASGGMGTVYEAEQENPKRIVALKVMRRGVASRYAMRHFEHESKILARLRHPNIAQVYAAGTHVAGTDSGEGVPFFAMEFIPEAQTITEYASGNKLDTRQRLDLFVQVCEAVHHGHQKSVIHRDLKPGNILVDPAGNVKVIDFGVARSTDSDIAVTTMRSDVGQLVGTLQYMSPEQCNANSGDVDTRTDVYSLGVVLYELICDQLPYDVSKLTIHAAVRIICEEQAAQPSAIVRKLRGDLELIVLTAIEKDREERYQSAADLASDVRRFLNREPIDARPPSVSTRLVRWCIRRPAAATTAICLLIAVSVLCFTVSAVWQFDRRPHRLEIGDFRQEARLLAYAGRTIRSWRTAKPGHISMAELVDEPEAQGGRRLAILGFSLAVGASPFTNSLCAYDVEGDLCDPLWERHIEDEDVPVVLRKDRGYLGASFRVALGTMADVFPGDEFPGNEIVAVHQHESTTHSAIRVYDFQGNLLYQIWVDTDVKSVYWMADARLLILAGLNGSAYWRERGYSVKVAHPTVVFAIRPTLGFITREYLSETPSEDQLSPAWLKCLLPPKMSDVFGPTQFSVSRPALEYDATRMVQFSVHGHEWSDENRPSSNWVLNEHGRVVPGSRTATDFYKIYQSELPKLSDVYLGDLPPVVSPMGEHEPSHSDNGKP